MRALLAALLLLPSLAWGAISPEQILIKNPSEFKIEYPKDCSSEKTEQYCWVLLYHDKPFFMLVSETDDMEQPIKYAMSFPTTVRPYMQTISPEKFKQILDQAYGRSF